MADDLPDYYFRIRENGAFVFRVETENRHGRLELEQIAAVNVRNGEVKPQGDRTLSPEDEAAIAAWMEERRATLARRDFDEVRMCIERMNLTAHWANSRATDDQLEEVTDDLLLAIYDLRGVLVRRKADRVTKARG